MIDLIPIPPVVHHDDYRTMAQVQSVCQTYVEQEQKPCAVVTIDDKICYAYMELDGSSDPVQCFIRIESVANEEQ